MGAFSSVTGGLSALAGDARGLLNSKAGQVLDFVPGYSNIAGAAKGNVGQAVGGVLDPLLTHAKNAINVGPQPGVQPGVAPGAPPPTALVQDPATGLFYSAATGQAYTDATGTVPVADPNIAQQVAANVTTGHNLLAQGQAQNAALDQVAGQGNALLGQQQQLGGILQNTITNPNANSVARAQLAQTTDANGRAILGAAAGVGGANAYDARRTAISALAGANTASAGQAAVLRQKEIADATSGLTGVLAGQGNTINQLGERAQGRQNTDYATGANYAGLGQKGETDKASINAKVAQGNQDVDEKYAGALFKLASGAGGGGGAGG